MINFKKTKKDGINLQAVVPTTIKGGVDTLYARVGAIKNLTTTAKDDLVNAINEVNAKPSGATYTAGAILRTATTQAEEVITITDNKIGGILLPIPTAAGGIVKSVGTTLNVDTAGVLTNKYIKTSGDQNDLISLGDENATTVDISAKGNLKAIEVGLPSDSTNGIKLLSTPLGDTDIADKQYVDSKAGATYTATAPIEITDNAIGIKLNSDQFTVEVGALNINASGIDTIVTAFLATDPGKLIIETIVKAMLNNFEDPNA